MTPLVSSLLSPHGTRGKLRLLLVVLPIVGVLAAIPLFHVWRRAYYAVVGEDHLAEMLTVVAYVPVVWLALVVARRLARAGLRLESGLWVLLALAAFFIAGEEISWGQRQLGFDGPELLVERNLQGEANLHNLLGLYGLHTTFLLVAAYGMFLARVLVPRIPRLKEHPWLFVPQRDLVAWFGICFAYYLWDPFLDAVLVAVFGDAVSVGSIAGPKLQESAELALGVGILLFAARVARRPHPELAPEPVTEASEGKRPVAR